MTRKKPADQSGLDPEDAELWSKVAESVKPLKPPHAAPRLSQAIPLDTKTEKAKTTVEATPRPVKWNGRLPPSSKPPTQKAETPPKLEPRTRQRISKGQLPIEARIDLHGMRQNEAHDALRRFLISAQSRGHRNVLVITGKGSARGSDRSWWQAREEPGVLRRLVPQWLMRADLRPLVIGIETAHRNHGGEGALYVRLRRKTVAR